MKNPLTFLVTGLLGAMLFAASPASATTLFAGGEDSDFTMHGAMSVNTNSSSSTYFASGYARESLYISSSGSNGTTLPLSDYALTPTFAANSTLWVHAIVSDGNGSGGYGTNFPQLVAYSPDGVARLVVRDANSTRGQWKISTVNNAGTFTDLVSMSSSCFTGYVFNKMDFYINYSASGEVTLYCNGSQVADYTGNVTTNSATQINQIQFAGDYAWNTCCEYWSEIIVATTDTRNLRLATLAPSANGNNDNWDTGGVSNVNETTDNTSTVNASGTAGQIQEYTVTALPSGSFQVQDLWVNMKAQVDTSGPQHIQGMVRTGSTDYTSSNLSPSQGSWGWISTDWTTNPNTGVAWTTGDLSAVGFNLGFKSAN
jgi:hypothetical protein